MEAQTYRSSPRLDKSNKAYLWWAEQKLANLLAVTLGTFIGLGYGAVHILKSLVPHVTSVDGAKRLWNGDPSARLGSHSRAYVKDSFADGRLKPSGYNGTTSSAPLTTGTGPALSNGGYSSGTTGYSSPATTKTPALGDSTVPASDTAYSKDTYSSSPPLNGTHPSGAGAGAAAATTIPATNGTSPYTSTTGNTTKQSAYNSDTTDVYPKETAYSQDTTAPKTGTTTPGLTTPGVTSPEDSGSETDDEAGSEYTATSSTPTTPRGSVLTAPADGNGQVKEKKKRRKKMAKGIKKTFSKITDALTPGSSNTSTA